MADLNQNVHAQLRIIADSDGAFAVEVLIPESCPTIVSSFSTEQAAATWIAGYHQQIEAKRIRKPTAWGRRSR